MSPSPLDPGYVDPVLARSIRRSGKFGRDLNAQIPGQAGPGFNPIDQTDQLLQPPLPNGAMQAPQSSGAAGQGTGQPPTPPSRARMDPQGMFGSAASPATPPTAGAQPPAPGPATLATASSTPGRQAPPGVNYAAQMAPLAQRQAQLTTPVGTPLLDQAGKPIIDPQTGQPMQGQRPVLQSKGVPGALQRVALALLSATKLAPYAQQIVHPQFTQELASNAAQLQGIQDQLGTLKEASAAQEQAGRAAWYQQQAEEGKGRYLRIGNGVFDQQTGQWAEQPTDKTNLVRIDPEVARERGIAPLTDGSYWVPSAVASQIVRPLKGPGDQIEINAAEGARLGIQPDKEGKYYLPKEGIGPYVTGHEKPTTPQTSAQMDARAQSLLAKLGPVPPGAFTDYRVLGPIIDKASTLTADEKAELRAHFLDKTAPSTSGTGGILRIEALGDTRQATFVNTQSGQEQTMTMTEFADKEHKNPGQWVEAGKAIPVQKAGAVYRSLHQSIGQVRNTLPALGTLDAGTRAALANALRNPNPESALQEFMQGTISRMTLTPQQEDAINAIRTLGEDALSLRMLVGMGQGSETQRQAILNTLPSAISASPHMMQGQLDNVERLLGTLEGGLPGLGRAGTAAPSLGPTGTAPVAPAAAGDMVQVQMPNNGAIGPVHRTQVDRFLKDHPGSKVVTGAR